MEVLLGPTWMLSTEHVACANNEPVLVNCETDETYGPQDLVPTDLPGVMKAAEVVFHLIVQYDFLHATPNESALIDRFRGVADPEKV